jgi:hypothetical protein
MPVSVAIAAIGSGELTIDVDDQTGFARSRTGVVTGKDAGRGTGDDHCLVPSKETKWDSYGAILSRKAERGAVERVDQNPADAGGR